jgi:putative endonuclease
MAEHNDLGKKGEELALAHLRNLGMEILESNWRLRKYEVDIIAIDGDFLVIAEVKTRRTNYFGEPQEFVNRAKQRQLIEAANAYIESKNYSLEVRFDIVSVLYNSEKSVVFLIKDAFSAFG